MNGKMDNMSGYTHAMRILHSGDKVPGFDPIKEIPGFDPAVDPETQAIDVINAFDDGVLADTVSWAGLVLESIDPDSKETLIVFEAAQSEKARRAEINGRQAT